VERRDIVGGPARARVTAAIAELRTRIAARGFDVDEIATATKARAVVHPRRSTP
jgi:hypothetical protein